MKLSMDKKVEFNFFHFTENEVCEYRLKCYSKFHDILNFQVNYSKTGFLVQIKFITKEKHQTHIIILILNQNYFNRKYIQ
jgi:hypothetical protein